MVSYWFGRGPELQGLRTIRIAFQFLCIDESVYRRHVALLQDLQDILRRLGSCDSGRQLAIQR